MIKRVLALVLLPAAYYLQAQDVSTVTNAIDVYTKGASVGTARYSSMAGAMGALGGDLSAASVNPAGIGVFITGEISGTMSFGSSTNTSTIAQKSVDYKINKNSLGQIGGVASFNVANENSKWKFVNVGINYANQSIENYVETPANGMNISRNLTNASGNVVTGTFSNLGHAYNRLGSVSKTTFSVGANYDNNIYFGAGLNFSDAEIEQYDSQNFRLDQDNQVYQFNKRFTPYSEISNGFSLSAGVIAKIDKNFRVGASLESPTWWSLQRSFTGQDWDNDDNVITDVYDEDRSFSTPTKLTLSGAYVANKNFAVNIDYTLGLSKPSYKVQGDAETELNDFFKGKDYKNISELKIGGEFREKGFRARAGYGFAANPFDGDMLLGKRHTLAAGLGYDFKGFYIDATYQHSNASFTNYYGAGNYFTDSISLESSAAASPSVKNVRNNFFLTLGARF